MTDLTDSEQRLVAAVGSGEVLDLSGPGDRSVRARVVRDLLRGVLTADPDPRGVRLKGAVVEGELDLTDLRTALPLVLLACTSDEPLVLVRAHLPHCDLTGSRFRAVGAASLRCDHDLVLRDTRCERGVDLTDARISGSLVLEGAHLGNPEGPALAADGVTVGGDVVLRDGFRADATSTLGAVRLLGAAVTGQLDLRGAHLANPEGPALAADGIAVKGDVFLNEGFRAEAASADGAVRLLSARISGSLSLGGARLDNPEGPALLADGVAVDGDVLLNEGFRAEATCADGAVRLHGAAVAGQFFVEGATLRNRHEDRLCLDLASAAVGGDLALPLDALGTPDEPGRVVLDGLRYPAIPWGATLSEWLTLLRERTTTYAAQPYQQLAVVHRAAGHERDARRVLVAQQRDLRRRGDLGGPLRRALHATGGVLIGYGYRPWRALAFLLAVLGLATALVLSADANHLTAHPRAVGGDPCTLVENVGLGADIAIPLLGTGGKQRCELTTATTAGQWHLGAAYVLQVLGWAFATLFVAGYTGLVRKT